MLLTEQELLGRIDDLVKVSRSFAKQKLINKARLRLEKRMELMFKKQQKIVLKLLARYKDMFEEALSMANLESILMVAEGQSQQVAEAAIEQAVKDGLINGAKAFISEIRLLMKFDLANPAAVDYLERFGAKKVTQINGSTRKYINSIVKQSADEGWSYSRTAKAIGERYKDMWVGKPQQHIASRAHFIAVTEVGNAYMEGQMMVGFDLDAVGLSMEKFWSTMGDANVSDGCAENQNAGWIDVKFAFPSGHLRPLRFPGCRCDLLQRVAEGVAPRDLPPDMLPEDYVDYREYMTDDDIKHEFNPQYEEWAHTRPDTQEWAIQEYTNGSYTDLNRSLREGIDYDDFVDDDLADVGRWLQDAVDDSPGCPEDLILNRGFASQDVTNAITNGRLDIGDIIEEKQFLSTTLSAENAQGFADAKQHAIRYKIQVPKGSKFAYVDDLTQFAGEFEAILPPGTKLKIVGIRSETIRDRFVYHLDLLLQ